ncbi:hypothetical protein NW768_008165 [Fusarium equiseti]|uniref:Uncharacterized protein n=1 Tax=Fusarium equiseti TaxID=61235 RepID=A0ABQ8R6B2_FUSEQ|nr:hypothetical protein NW768_008165 [Fusarium equiseti]
MRFSYIAIFYSIQALAADIQVVWRLEKETNASSLSAVSDKGTVIAETCGSIIHAKHSIDFSDVDGSGTGNFSIGDASFMVHSKPEWSGGPVCSRVFNPQYTLVQCSGVDWDSKDVARSKNKDCFSSGSADRELQSLQSRSQIHEMHSRGVGLKERQYQCSGWSTKVELVGDGNPHQNYHHKQISESITCNNANACGVVKAKSESFTVGFSVSAGGPADNWISGGFEVSKSWTDANEYSCEGAAGDTVCIWYSTAHTAYTVKKLTSNPCTGTTKYGPYIIFSPNKQNRGGGYYCVNGACRAKDDEYWDYNGRAGVA